MHSLASLHRARLFPATSVLRFYGALNPVSGNHPVSANFTGGYVETENVILFFVECCWKRKCKTCARNFKLFGYEFKFKESERNVSAPYALGFRNIIRSTGQKNDKTRSSRPMDFVRG